MVSFEDVGLLPKNLLFMTHYSLKFHNQTDTQYTLGTVNDVSGKDSSERPPRGLQGSEGSFQGIFHLERPLRPPVNPPWGYFRGVFPRDIIDGP